MRNKVICSVPIYLAREHFMSLFFASGSFIRSSSDVSESGERPTFS